MSFKFIFYSENLYKIYRFNIFFKFNSFAIHFKMKTFLGEKLSSKICVPYSCVTGFSILLFVVGCLYLPELIECNILQKPLSLGLFEKLNVIVYFIGSACANSRWNVNPSQIISICWYLNIINFRSHHHICVYILLCIWAQLVIEGESNKYHVVDVIWHRNKIVTRLNVNSNNII